jgi:hypothetical protein
MNVGRGGLPQHAADAAATPGEIVAIEDDEHTNGAKSRGGWVGHKRKPINNGDGRFRGSEHDVESHEEDQPEAGGSARRYPELKREADGETDPEESQRSRSANGLDDF